MKRLFLLFTLFVPLLLGASAPANPARQTLERSLTYFRVHALPDDLLAASATTTGTLVLDLRFVRANREAATAFASWLKARSRPSAPVLVLVNPDTDRDLLASLAVPGVVSIGPAAPGITPDVPLPLDVTADRTAYEAFDQGTPIDELINPKIDKVRHDEAAIARDRTPGASADQDNEPPPAVVEKASPPPATAVTPPPVDRVLQRAVQLHHALQALKKIP